MAKIDMERLLGENQPITLEFLRLELIDPLSNSKKFYELRIERNINDSHYQFSCVAYYGRLDGKSIKKEVKLKSDVKLLTKIKMSKIINEKVKKGYVIVP
jgi:predicted DNA-binding WGR domain protein